MLNPDKFQFPEKSVDLTGFRLSDSTIEPLPKYLDAIKDFPSPTSTTDIRSWFGLVNQVSNYAQLQDSMAPFKPFLSPLSSSQHFKRPRKPSSKLSARGWKSSTYRGAPASAL